jgi:hypothetical protein
MHAVGPLEEVAALGGQRARAVDQPAQRGGVHRLRMGARADLWQLLRITEQQQIVGRARHRNGVGETELAGLVDNEEIEAARRNPAGVGEIPRRTADHAALGGGRQERGVLVVGDLLPRRRALTVRRLLLGHLQRGGTAVVDHACE